MIVPQPLLGAAVFAERLLFAIWPETPRRSRQLRVHRRQRCRRLHRRKVRVAGRAVERIYLGKVEHDELLLVKMRAGCDARPTWVNSSSRTECAG